MGGDTMSPPPPNPDSMFIGEYVAGGSSMGHAPRSSRRSHPKPRPSKRATSSTMPDNQAISTSTISIAEQDLDQAKPPQSITKLQVPSPALSCTANRPFEFSASTSASSILACPPTVRQIADLAPIQCPQTVRQIANLNMEDTLDPGQGKKCYNSAETQDNLVATDFKLHPPLKDTKSIPSKLATHMEPSPTEPEECRLPKSATVQDQNTDPLTQRNQNVWNKPKFVTIDEIEDLSTITEDGITVTPYLDAVQANVKKLEKGLVGKIIGRRLPFQTLSNELKLRWAHVGDFSLIMTSGDSFTCIFDSIESRDAILMGGPWFVAGQLIGLDRWSESHNPNSMNGMTTPIWIRFPHLPLPYWDKRNIARLATMIGKPLWLDDHTHTWGRSSFARICVRLDLSRKLPAGVWIQGLSGRFFQPVEYEGLSKFCFKCGLIGHKMTFCPTNNSINSVIPPNQEARPQSKATEDVTTDKGKAPIIEPTPDIITGTKVHMNASVAQNGNHAATVGSIQQHASSLDDYGPWTLVTRRKFQQGQSSRQKQVDRDTRTTQVHNQHQKEERTELMAKQNMPPTSQNLHKTTRTAAVPSHPIANINTSTSHFDPQGMTVESKSMDTDSQLIAPPKNTTKKRRKHKDGGDASPRVE